MRFIGWIFTENEMTIFENGRENFVSSEKAPLPAACLSNI
jgi:hypothetical protein